MAVQASRPQRIQATDQTQNFMTLAGAGAGAYATGGSPQGIATGAQLGGMAGGMMSDKGPQSQTPQLQSSGAMDRRMQQLNNDPLKQIRDGIDSLKYVQDDQQRQELAKPLFMAEYMARNSQA